jgi:hypothetical protein
MTLVMGASLIFMGCSKDYVEPDHEKKDQVIIFNGTCTPVEMTEEINKWYDKTNDWRVTGHTIWEQPDPDVFAGTATLIVDPMEADQENAGIWALTWEGTMCPQDDGSTLICAKAVGVGIEGEVAGLKAEWVYSMEYDGSPATFFYDIQGNYTSVKAY